MNETGRKTFFWYRVYCAILVCLYLALTIFGLVLVSGQPLQTQQYNQDELMLVGYIYTLLGAILFFAFTVALFLPPKPYNWIVGIVMMALGMTSCCFIPFLIPLLIFWLKPETKAFLGVIKKL